MSTQPSTSAASERIAYQHKDCQLEIEFDFHEGQYSHTLFIGQSGKPTACLRSIRSAVESENPAFQELSIQEDGQGQAIAFLVGQANKIHWSMSVQLDLQQQRLVFELAARVSAVGSQNPLASGYQLMADQWQMDEANHRLTLVDGLGQYRLQPYPLGDSAPANLSMVDDQLRIMPDFTSSQSPATISWKYALYYENEPKC